MSTGRARVPASGEMIAVIGDSANAASIGLHAELGFRHVGTLQAVGFKFGRWIDSVLMQRPLSCERSTARPAKAGPRDGGAGDPGPGARDSGFLLSRE